MEIFAERTRKGKSVTICIIATLTDHSPQELPNLTIQQKKEVDSYTVEEYIPDAPFDGRAFQLKKQDGEVYSVFLARNGQDNLCCCRGFESTSRCKHIDSLSGLCEGGAIPEPGSDREESQWPTKEQMEEAWF